MQHSPLTYSDVAQDDLRLPRRSAMPFIRVPDATESDIQKATDIGALGIIVPTVDTVEKAAGRREVGEISAARDAAAWAAGQYRELYGSDYRQTANDNMVVVIMIETPIGVDNAEKIAVGPRHRRDFRRQHRPRQFLRLQNRRAAI